METLKILILIIAILAAPCQSFWWYYDYSDSDYSSWWPSYDYGRPAPTHEHTREDIHHEKKSGPWDVKTDVVKLTDKDSIPFYEPPRIEFKIDPYNLFNSHIDVTIPMEKKIEQKEQFVDQHAINNEKRVDVHDTRHDKTSSTRNNDYFFRIG